jgi:hypothetical protein
MTDLPDGEAEPAGTGSATTPALWAPFRGGTVVGFGVLAALAVLASVLEGGATSDARWQRAFARVALLAVAACVLGFYARRIIVCASEDDRPVPWFRDERDGTPWTHAVGHFVAVAVIVFAPLIVWSFLRRVLEAPSWLSILVSSACLVLATYQLPFSLAGAVLRGSALAAGPATALRVLRADFRAARAAVTPTFVFLALVAASFVVSGAFNPSPDGGRTIDDHTVLRESLRVAAAVLRIGAAWAALVCFRAVGLLVRDAPRVREVLR